MHNSVILWDSPQWTSEILVFLAMFRHFVEQTKEIMYWKWNMILLADLLWTWGQHVLFRNIFVFVYICVYAYHNHNNLNFVLFCLFQAFLQYFDMFVDLRPDLDLWHVLFNIFGCFCLHLCVHTKHNNLNFLLIN